MACCKAEDFKWCKDLETVYTDEEGKDYCVFHAPKGKKGVASIEEFNDLISTRILEARNSYGICDLSGTIFSKTIDFRQFCDKDYLLPALNLSYTTFSDRVLFGGVIFKGNVQFDKVIFKGYASFARTIFIDNAYFEGAIFKGIANFENSKFNKEAYFMNAKFIGDAHFEAAVFDGIANFSSKSDPWTIKFGKHPNLGMIIMLQTDRMKTFTSTADFKMTEFRKDTNFRGCSSNDIILFEDVDLSRVSFLETNLREFNFVRCTWQQKFGRNVLYDEIRPTSKNWTKSFEKVEDLYRQLKQKYKEEHNEPEVSNWHYGEKEMFRKKRWFRRRNPFSLYNLYWASSGYGENPILAGIILLLLFILITTGMNFFGLIPFGNEKSVFGFTEINGFSGSFDWGKFKLLVFNTIQYTLFFKTPFFKPETINGYIFQAIFTRLLIPIQATLFAFALRNKFRR